MGNIICPVCKTNNAFYHDYYGYLPCVPCQKSQKRFSSPTVTVEMTSQDIKDQRATFKEDIIQPFREGVVSKEYLEQYGTKGIKATKQEIKKARNVWNSEEYYKK